MELIRGLYNLPPPEPGCVVTIGNFDGVHLGHQQILAQLADTADELNLPSVVLMFEPQPSEYFYPDVAVPRLTRLREKYLELRRHSVDRLVCLRFDRALANLSAEEFVQHLLVDGLGVKHLIVGDDFRFGKGRGGDYSLLEALGDQAGFGVGSTATFEIDGGRVSSTRIRDALVQGDLEIVRRLLGRPYTMSGRVAHGDQRGRTIGFPTANIFLHRRSTPVQGVYAVRMHGIEPTAVKGVANVGTRPTIDGTTSLLEVHLFDFSADIYNRYVEVEFDYKLRDERKFDSFEALREQILLDADEARAFFGMNKQEE